MTRILADADMILFQAVASAQLELEWETDIWIWQADIALARDKFWEHVAEAGALVGASVDDVILCFTSKSGFRRDIYPDYKSGRKDRKPPGYGFLKADILNEESAVQHDQIEADDVLSILARELARELGPASYVVYSGDKDLAQVPGVHIYRDREAFMVSDEDAERNTWRQALTGDTTDGVPGCPGIGPVKADKLLADLDPMDEQACWEAVRNAYIKAGKTDLYALTMTRLTRLLRPCEYDFSTSTPTLWTPKR